MCQQLSTLEDLNALLLSLHFNFRGGPVDTTSTLIPSRRCSLLWRITCPSPDNCASLQLQIYPTDPWEDLDRVGVICWYEAEQQMLGYVSYLTSWHIWRPDQMWVTVLLLRHIGLYRLSLTLDGRTLFRSASLIDQP
jgi:hypothetical protein